QVAGGGGRKQSGGTQGALEGNRLGDGRDVRLAAVKNVEVRCVLDLPISAVETAQQRRCNHLGRQIEILGPDEEVRKALPIVRLVAPGARFGQGGNQQSVLRRTCLG